MKVSFLHPCGFLHGQSHKPFIVHIWSCSSFRKCVHVGFVGSTDNFMGFLYSFGHLARVDYVNIRSMLYVCLLFLHPLSILL
jgi:hypothetical protein